MPTSKNAIRRIQIIDNKLSDGSYHRAEDLISILAANGLTVCRTQVYEDLVFMHDALQCPLAFKRGKGWFYTTSFHLFSKAKQRSNVSVIDQMKTTIKRFSALEGLPCDAWLNELAKSINEELGECTTKETYISFERNTNPDVIKKMSRLLQYIETKKVLAIDYTPFEKDKRTYIIHPYYIKQYNNRLFLFGWNNDKEEDRLWNLPLDRINTFTPVKDIAFKPKPADLDFNTYFKDIIGVTILSPNDLPQKVLLKFTPERMHYVCTRPIHPSQQLVEGHPNTISLHVIPNRELTAAILYFGKDVKVLAPASLREEVAANLKAASTQYSQP